MAQTGFTPIQIYYSTTTTNAPSAGNLTDGELAINTADGKLFYKDNLGAVQVIAWKTTPTTAGGTGLTSWTAGDLPYYATGTTLTKLGIGSAGQILTSTGTAPQWSTLSGVAVTTFSAGTTGFTPSVATSGAITLAGTLATTNGGTGLTTFGAANRAIYSTSSSALTAGTLPTAAGGTGLTSFTANGVVYASSSSALTTGSALTFDGTNLGLGNSISGPAGYTSMNAGGTGTGGMYRVNYNGINVGQFYVDSSENLWIENFRSAKPIIFATSAGEGMRLTSTGLGIGTSSPLVPLTVQRTAAATNTRITVAQLNRATSGTAAAGLGGYLQLQAQDDAGTQREAAAISWDLSDVSAAAPKGRLYLGTRNANDAVVIDNSGNLGLGVTPSSNTTDYKLLEIGGGGNSLAGWNNASVPILALTSNAYRDGSTWKYKVTGENAVQFIAHAFDGDFRWLTAASGTAGNTISFSQVMTLDASGNLGIGTASPQEKLDVRGKAYLNNGGALFLDSAASAVTLAASGARPFVFEINSAEQMRLTSTGLGIGTSSPSGKLHTVQSNGINYFESPGISSIALQFVTNSTNRYRIGIPSGSTDLQFLAGGTTETMRLDSSGNLGIGTSSPAYKLDVVGNAGIARIQSTGAGQNAQLNLQSTVATWSVGQNITLASTGTLEFYNGSTRLQLDSSGNLGLGVTPSAYNTGSAFDIGGRGGLVYYGVAVGNFLALSNNVYYNAGYKYKVSAGAGQMNIGNDGSFSWFNAPSGTAGNAISFTQAMTLDASGNLVVGGTSANVYGVSKAITLNATSGQSCVYEYTIAGTSTGYFGGSSTATWVGSKANIPLVMYTNDTERARITSGGQFAVVGAGSASAPTISKTDDLNTGIFFPAADTIAFAEGGAESMRIDSSGNLLIAMTSTDITSGGVRIVPADGGTGVSAVSVGHSSSGGSGSYYSSFHYSGTVIGSITQNGTTAVAYNTTSDYRLKSNPQPLTGSGAFIDALKPKTWDWTADGTKGVGFIAHEVQEVSPGSVVGTKDAVDAEGKPVYQAMEYGSAEFIANIIAELQSLRQRVAALEAK